VGSYTDRFVKMPSGGWFDSWTGDYLSDSDIATGRFQPYPTAVPQIMGREGMSTGAQNYSRSETRTVEVKAETEKRKIRKTEVPSDVEQLPEEIRIISEERIGDKHRARAHEWLAELQVNGYFLESEDGEYDRRVAYVNEARTAKQLAAVMDDLPPMRQEKKYHGSMAPGADEPDLGKWLKDHRKLLVGIFSFPPSVLLALFSALVFFSGHHTVAKWVAGALLIVVSAIWFLAAADYCATKSQ
jgi:hypothetical protein